jgi:GNAT superfamily N-acetyltransferase
VAEITVRVAKSQQDAAAIHAFMLSNAVPEMAEASVDGRVYMQTIWRTVQHGIALIAIEDEQIVGYLGLVESPYSYSRESFLHDAGFFVLPQYRGGAVSRKLIAEARAVARKSGLTLRLVDISPSPRRKARRGRAVTGRVLTYYPEAH